MTTIQALHLNDNLSNYTDNNLGYNSLATMSSPRSTNFSNIRELKSLKSSQILSQQENEELLQTLAPSSSCSSSVEVENPEKWHLKSSTPQNQSRNPFRKSSSSIISSSSSLQIQTPEKFSSNYLLPSSQSPLPACSSSQRNGSKNSAGFSSLKSNQLKRSPLAQWNSQSSSDSSQQSGSSNNSASAASPVFKSATSFAEAAYKPLGRSAAVLAEFSLNEEN